MKTVVFSQRVEVNEKYNERRDCADQRISEFIFKCGFLPVPVPNNSEIVQSIINEIKPSGIILVGGNSLTKYGGNAPERDAADKVLIENAINRKIPLYGFCRGMQSILDFFGNELVKVDGHVAVRHRIFNASQSLEVNSYHNEGCLQLNNNELIVEMKSEDGVIEQVRHRTLPILGTMWHPERETPFKESDKKLIRRIFSDELCVK